MIRRPFFFFNDTATTEIYTLSLHDALPISADAVADGLRAGGAEAVAFPVADGGERSEEHTSELQSQSNLVCRLLLEKKKKRQPAPQPVKQVEVDLKTVAVADGNAAESAHPC